MGKGFSISVIVLALLFSIPICAAEELWEVASGNELRTLENTEVADFKPQDKTIFMDEWLEYAVTDVPKLFANQPRPLNETQPTSRQRNDRPRLVLLKRQLADPGACGPAPSAGPSRTQEQQPSLFDFTRRKREVALVRNP